MSNPTKPVEGKLRVENSNKSAPGICYILADGQGVGSEVAVVYNGEANAAELVFRWNKYEQMHVALEHLSECNLNDGNCASLELASKRVRNIARAALNATK